MNDKKESPFLETVAETYARHARNEKQRAIAYTIINCLIVCAIAAGFFYAITN